MDYIVTIWQKFTESDSNPFLLSLFNLYACLAVLGGSFTWFLYWIAGVSAPFSAIIGLWVGVWIWLSTKPARDEERRSDESINELIREARISYKQKLWEDVQ